jgi:hypothetical protein
MSEQSWALLILACEIVGLVAMFTLIGKRRVWWGWLVIVACVSLPWLIYSISTWKIGFILLSVLWLTVHLSNAYNWKKREQA